MLKCQDTVLMTGRRQGSDVTNGSSWGIRSHPRSIFSGLTPATGALLEWTVISLGTRGKSMENLNMNKKQDDDEVNNGHHAQQAALDASADMKRTQAWDRLEKLISELHEFVQPRANVHKEIKSKVASIGSAYKRLKALEDTRVTHQRPAISALEVVCTPPIPRSGTVTETTVTDTEVDADVESITGDNRDIRKAKRKQRTSPGSGSKKPKKRKEAGPTPPTKETVEPPMVMDWEQVRSRKAKKQRTTQPLKPPQQKKSRKSVTRPNALIVRPKEKGKYAEILSRVKKEVPEDQVSGTVDKIRRTTTGDLLIILTKENTDKGHGLQQTIAGLLKDDAEVICKGPQEDLEIRDLDEMTTKEEILAALQKAAGGACGISSDAIKSLRKAYGGTQTASVTLAASMVEKVVGEHGKIRIGWVNCRIRTVDRPTKCFKCWHYGHLATKCKSEVDRSSLCTKCGEDGHKVAACKKDARCALCAEKDNTKNCAHIAGSSRCPAFQEALQKVRKKRV